MEGGGFLFVAEVCYSVLSCCSKKIGKGNTFSVEDFLGKEFLLPQRVLLGWMRGFGSPSSFGLSFKSKADRHFVRSC